MLQSVWYEDAVWDKILIKRWWLESLCRAVLRTVILHQ